MGYLIVVSLVWGLSFGLIKTQLAGLDASFVSLVRLTLSLLLFLPWLRPRAVPVATATRLAAVGAIQFGLMYVAYVASFRFLKAHQVALFTIFTPLYVTLINDLCARRFHPHFLVTVALAVAGTGILVYREIQPADLGAGFALVQFSNLCFAAGQVFYPRIMRRCPGAQDKQVFGFLYAGAVVAAGLAALFTTDWAHVSVSGQQAGVLLYLGLVASGLCFFLWNLGARRTNPGALAIANNLKIPFAILCAVLLFGESVPWLKLLAGGTLVAGSLWLNEWLVRRRHAA
jgi:drug/metabolite transporter (DMT)-like permease